MRVLLDEGEPTSHAGADTADRFRQLAAGELDRAYRLAGLLLGDQPEAEDATQEALVRAWRAAGTLRDPEGFQAWFDRILVNICRDRLRRRGRVRFIQLDAVAEPVAEVDPFRSVLERDEVVRAMTLLDPDQRVVVVLHYFADLTLAAVAQRTGWPEGTVKSRLHHALRTMHAGLTESAARAPGDRP